MGTRQKKQVGPTSMNENTKLIFTSIDFGTTFSAIGYVTSPGKGTVNPPKAIKYSGLSKIPTAVFFLRNIEKEPYVGQEAQDEIEKNPESSEYFFTEFKLELINPKPRRLLPDGQPAPSATTLTKYIFKRLRDIAYGKNEISLDKSVVCHPVGTSWSLRLRKIAEEEVGLQNINLMTEPMAALYYANHLHRIFDDRSKLTLLIDFGGGTCDLFLLEVTLGFKSGRFRIGYGPEPKDQDQLTYRTLGGAQSYGGKDIDNLLIQVFKKKWSTGDQRTRISVGTRNKS